MTEYIERTGTTVTNHRWNIVYNVRGQVSGERNFQDINGATDIDATITNTYDNYGNMTYTVSHNAGITDTSQAWTFGAWYGGAVVTHSTYDKDYYGSNTLWNSDQYYDGLGRLQRAIIVDGKPRAVHYALNADGLVVQRFQNDNTSNDPSEVHRFVSGKQIGESTNDTYEDTRNYDYQTLISDKTSSASGTGRFYHGATTAVAGGEFGTSGYDPVNAITSGVGQNGRSRYTVQSGDTLQGIAASLWGDSSLWYKIAEANGLSADSTLIAGQGLNVPLQGPANRSNADMFRPYDPSSAVGDLNPTSAKPPKKNKCGVFGQILMVVIAVAVTAVTAGAAAIVAFPSLASGGILAGLSALGAGALGTAGIAIGAGAAALGSIVSQGFGLATGIQDKFSWKGVALSALAGGIGAGVSLGAPGGGVLGAAARGAASSALTQGIGVVTGLQNKFDWAGVAAAGVGAGAGQALGGVKGFSNLDAFTRRAALSMAGGIANAASRSLVNGSDFGDNLVAALPDIIGQTIGGIIADGVSGRTTRAPGAGSTEEAAAGSTGQTAQPDADTIVVNQKALDAVKIGLPPEDQISLAEAAEQISSDDAARLSIRLADIKSGLRDQYMVDNNITLPPVSTAQVDSEGRPYVETEAHGYATDLGTLDAWVQSYNGGYVEGINAPAGKTEYMASIEANRQLVFQWDAAAERQINREFGGFLATGILGGAALAATPLVSTWAATNYGLGTTAYYGATATFGGSSGYVLGLSRDYMFGKLGDRTWGTVVGDTAGGAIFSSILTPARLTSMSSIVGRTTSTTSAGAASSGGSEFFGQSVDILTGDRSQYNWLQIGTHTAVGGATGWVTGNIELRSPQASMFEGITTRLNSGTISRYSVLTGTRGAWGQATVEVPNRVLTPLGEGAADYLLQRAHH